jgi:hypothetical protein
MITPLVVPVEVKSDFDSEGFLNSEIEIDGEWMLAHRRICFLLLANGGPNFSEFSDEEPQIIKGHQRGLTPSQTIELLRLKAFIDGLSAAGVIIKPLIEAHFRDYLREFAEFAEFIEHPKADAA